MVLMTRTLRNYVQTHHGWDDRTWNDIDCHTFGLHFRRLPASRRSQHFKFIHDQLPLGDRRYSEQAPVKHESLKLCPCCKEHNENPLHFLRCRLNPSFAPSLATLKSDILTKDVHPVRYLLADGICHLLQHQDTPFCPSITQYPSIFMTSFRLLLWRNNKLAGLTL